MSIKTAELFAGVGGFRLALEGYDNPNHPEYHRDPAGPFVTVWANQWEPPGTQTRQFAWRCYEERFGAGSCINEDINLVMDKMEAGTTSTPDVDLLVGGFPCQDYSVSKPLSLAKGIEGAKGVLWWDILRFIQATEPRFLLLENVDRLLKSPSKQRGRDFAIILACLNREGYSVEWRVINGADYGMPQKRRRVYIFAERDAKDWDLNARLLADGVIARAFPVEDELIDPSEREAPIDPYAATNEFGVGDKVSFFKTGGVMSEGQVLTAKLMPVYEKPRTLASIRVPDAQVPPEFFIDPSDLPKWEEQRASKHIERTTADGFTYTYSEGAMVFPDPLDKPARTILTGEGGKGASRMKHAIEAEDGRIRRLVPDELDQIQCFPKGWTDAGMTDGQRAFCMGNALIVDIPHRIGRAMTALYDLK